MYSNHIKIKDSKHGKGLFTEVKIPMNIPLFEFTGNLYKLEELPDKNHPAIIQVGLNAYLGPSGDLGDYINHSCDPNCKVHCVGNRGIVYSLYDIAIGSELTFDYSTTSTDSEEQWKLDCNCGSFKCRKVISGGHRLNYELVEEMNNKGMFPRFMQNLIVFKK